MTTVAVLQPGYLPWLGFFDQMNRADVFVYYDDVQFDKHGWRNRNRVKGPNGPVWLTVPVLHKGRSNQLIKAVEVRNEQPWNIKHVRTIRELYANAPFIKNYIGDLDSILVETRSCLVDICYKTTDYFRELLNIDTPIYRSSELDINGKRSQRLVELCKYFGADKYLSGNSAMAYLNTEYFDAAGIEVQWQNYKHPIYNQQHGPFLSHLSIVDLIMNLGPDSRNVISQIKLSD
ncbi:MAG: WbqC family protein [Rhodospirillaceae bacterium]